MKKKSTYASQAEYFHASGSEKTETEWEKEEALQQKDFELICEIGDNMDRQFEVTSAMGNLACEMCDEFFQLQNPDNGLSEADQEQRLSELNDKFDKKLAELQKESDEIDEEFARLMKESDAVEKEMGIFDEKRTYEE